MPNYAKFLKDVMSKKRRMADFETVNLTEECSAIIQRKLPQKLKDPGSFTIPCAIGGSVFNKALCDLGASINLMPLSIFKKLGLGEVKPTSVTLQLADRSLTYPRGVIEDVLVKVDKFIFPVDFIVLDMEEDRDVPLILGRPFLATGRALIDVQKGELTLRVNDEHILFTIYKAMRFHEETEQCHVIDVVDSCVGKQFDQVATSDALELCLTHSYTSQGTLIDFDNEDLWDYVFALDSAEKVPKRETKIEEIEQTEKGTHPAQPRPVRGSRWRRTGCSPRAWLHPRVARGFPRFFPCCV